MYYITEKTSETGKKFQEISKKRKIANDDAKQFAEKYGFNQYRRAYWQVFGGISSCLDFKETPDKKIWGKGAETGEHMPKRNSKIGKSIYKEIKDLTTVTIDELNQCIGFDGYPFKTIGYAENNEKYFGFIVDEKWNVKIPEDCTEIITTKYKELFNIK